MDVEKYYKILQIIKTNDKFSKIYEYLKQMNDEVTIKTLIDCLQYNSIHSFETHIQERIFEETGEYINNLCTEHIRECDGCGDCCTI